MEEDLVGISALDLCFYLLPVTLAKLKVSHVDQLVQLSSCFFKPFFSINVFAHNQQKLQETKESFVVEEVRLRNLSLHSCKKCLYKRLRVVHVQFVRASH